ncbi:LLM class flavin-dependent oxidoreductase [Cellulomonas sp. URHE0023]|uniref:LLM class flavin-dependent oxidoreductase n=1 Tax=Cellulomonas sp. URHE0023 TaxID=1380354 RepID=UPI000AA2DE64|nr:LLM class flavin-dependent oxidoreductase [Cellulomonas sp. URHE0023]
MTVGILLPRDLPIAQLVPYARRAEALGFAEIWVVEDLPFRGGIAQAGAVLAGTERIRVGVGILPAAVRNPAFAAMEASTLAELYPGRLVLGVGHGMTGWVRQVGAWPASPLTMLDEHVSAVRALLHGSSVTVDGRYVQLDAVQLHSPPSVVPPVLAGVRGPRSLALAGRVADGVVLAEPVTPEYLAGVLEHVGRQLPVVAYCVAAVDDDPDVARARVRPALEWIGEPDWDAHIAPLPFADDFHAMRLASSSRAEFLERMPADWVDQLAVVGTPRDARRRIAELHAAGVTCAVLIPVGSDPMVALDELASLV